MKAAVPSILRWSLLVASLLFVGPGCSLALSLLRDVDGGAATSMLISSSPLLGIAGGLLVFIGAGLVGVAGAYWFSMGWGYTCAGLVLAWGAWRIAPIDTLVRRSQGAGDLPWLAAEGLVAIALTLALAVVITHVARKRQPSPTAHASLPPLRPGLHLFIEHDDIARVAPVTGMAALAAGLAAGAIAYLVAASMLKGQTFFAACAAGLAAGIVLQVIATGQRARASPALGVLAMALPALVGPIAAQVMQGEAIVQAAYAGTLFPPARVLSLDWAAGALLGVPVGMGWAGAMLDTRAVTT
jgi:hypothetical protein